MTPTIDRVFCTLKQFQAYHLCGVSVGVHDRMRLWMRHPIQSRVNEMIALVPLWIQAAIQAPVRGEP